MAGPGPNDKCPCGSGKKFKRCCQEKQREEAASQVAALTAEAELRRLGIEPVGDGDGELGRSMEWPLEAAGLSPYVIGRTVEDPEALDDPALRPLLIQRLRDRWTFARVETMCTEAIEAQLLAFGVQYDRAQYVKWAREPERHSAWSIAEKWSRSGAVEELGLDEDFVGIAACELWKRLVPDKLSMEQLDELMRDGYAALERNERAAVCETWGRFWRALRERLTPELRTPAQAEAVFQGRQSVEYWGDDYEIALLNAGQRVDPKYLKQGIEFCEQWLAQFPDESEDGRCRKMRVMGEMLLYSGDARGEEVLEGLTERWPETAWGYVALGDAYSKNDPRLPMRRDLAKARAILERGLARVREDRDVIRQRLRDLPRR